MIGTIVDNYLIQQVLGKGGMGVVYKAVDTSLDKVVALKVMNPGLQENDRLLQRFKAEARALGRLQHPSIVNVLAFRHVAPHLLIVTEYVEGGTLADCIKRHGPLPWQTAMPLMRQALSAMAYAHHKKIIHRDLKPSNILLTRAGAVKVTDFGLAKIQATQAVNMTRTDVIAGTLHYMSPEHLEGLSRVDRRSDIYALGMTFYEMLAGKTPFGHLVSDFAIQQAIRTHDFPSLDQFNTRVPEPLVQIIMNAMEREPSDRYASADAMLEALARWEDQAAGLAQYRSRHVAVFAGRLRKRTRRRAAPEQQKTSVVGQGAASRRTARVRRRVPRMDGRPRFQRSVVLAGGMLLFCLLFVLYRPFGTALFSRASGNGAPGVSETTEERASPADASRSTPLLPLAQPDQPSRSPASAVSVPAAEPVAKKAGGVLERVPSQKSGHREPEPLKLPLDSTRQAPEGGGVSLAEASDDVPTPSPVSIHIPPSQQEPAQQEIVEASGQQHGTLRLKPSPWGNVYVDGEPHAYEVDYWVALSLPDRLHRITVRNPVLGRSWEMEVTPVPGDTQDVAIDFMARVGVNVAAKNTEGHPVSGEIYVDGNPTGDWSPRRIQVYPGLHRIEVRAAGYTQLEMRELRGGVAQAVDPPVNFSQDAPARIFHAVLQKTGGE